MEIYLFFALGFVLILKASDLFVDAAIWTARALRVPELIVGATLVSICTTLPETVVSSASALAGMPDMAFGNAYGSIVFNTAFILGLTFFIAQPLIKERASFLFNCVWLFLLAAATGVLFLCFGEISRPAGFALLALCALYLLAHVRGAQNKKTPGQSQVPSVETGRGAVIKNAVFLLLGAVGVVVGSRLLVLYGEQIALRLGVSELIIGVTVTAIGTSLPELVTAMTAVAKKAPGLSIGNIIGADILNIVLVMGLSAALSPVRLLSFSSALFSVASVLVIAVFMLTLGLTAKSQFTRRHGAMLLAMYAAYIVVNILYFA